MKETGAPRRRSFRPIFMANPAELSGLAERRRPTLEAPGPRVAATPGAAADLPQSEESPRLRIPPVPLTSGFRVRLAEVSPGIPILGKWTSLCVSVIDGYAKYVVD